MTGIEREIQALVEQETQAWDNQDAERLVSLFHPDLPWPWSPSEVPLQLGQRARATPGFHQADWRRSWNELFESFQLVRNERRTVRIQISTKGAGAFAVVDVQRVWRDRQTGESIPWRGRSYKGYTRVGDRWKLILHTGVPVAEDNPLPA